MGKSMKELGWFLASGHLPRVNTETGGGARAGTKGERSQRVYLISARPWVPFPALQREKKLTAHFK